MMLDASEAVRFLSLADMPKVAAIEKQCFSSFWSACQFAEAWQQDWFAGYGLFFQKKLAAYITMSVLAGELEVLNIAVLPEFRGRGFSHRLMAFALQDTLKGGHLICRGKAAISWEQAVLEVRTGNMPARALYTSMGFTIAGYRKHYYADGEDALLMTLSAKALLHSDIFSDNSSDVI